MRNGLEYFTKGSLGVLPAAGPALPLSPIRANNGARSEISDEALLIEKAEGGPHIGDAGPGDGVRGISRVAPFPLL